MQTDLMARYSVNQQQQQGIFLFQSASTALQNAGLGFLNPGLSPAFYGDNWLQDVHPIPGRPDPGLPDGIAGFVNQTALSSVPIVLLTRVI